MLLMAIGDSHGNSRFVHASIERAITLRDHVDRDVFIVSVGDFGFWPGRDGEAFLDGVDKAARDHHLAFWAIDGNHDYPGDSRSTRSGYRAWTDPDPSPDRPGLVHVPRGTVVEVSGATIGLCGGAASPDLERRQPGVSWWPDEMITDREVALIEHAGRRVDLMIAHDSPWQPPDFIGSMSISPRVRALMVENQLRLQEIVAVWQPQLLIHGHFHHGYRATARTPDGEPIKIVGIDDENIDTSIETIDLEAIGAAARGRAERCSADEDRDAVWADEIRRRVERIRSGASSTVPWREVRAEAEHRLRK